MLLPIDENKPYPVPELKLAPIFSRTSAPARKRARLDDRRTRDTSVTRYFLPATPTRPKAAKPDTWTIRRRRTGLGAYRGCILDTKGMYP